MHQFKEKSEQQRELVSAGLFFYPVLQAADVLAYRATEVPVGEDQRQHIELMRDIAERFNARFGETLVVPEGRYPEVGARIMDLQDPATRMSTTDGSEQGTVYILDEPEAVREEGQERRHRLRLRGPPGAGQGWDREPDRDPRGGARGSAPTRSSASSRARGYGDFKGAVADAVVGTWRRSASATPSCAPDGPALEAMLAAGPRRRARSPRRSSPTSATAMGVGRPP